MNWGPLRSARIDFSDPAAPAAPEFGDVYHARAGALAQAEHVFLGGNGLPGRWAGRARFVVLETGFGLGHNFLATWAAWQRDAQRCDRLWYVAIDKHPPLQADLARAHSQTHVASALPALARQLIAQWPPLTPDLHLIDFEAGRVRLLLALGDVARVLPDLVAQADAIYLDGFAPSRNPEMWDAYRLRSLARLAAPGATLATWSVAGAVRHGLQAAGFEVHKAPGLAPKREMTVARFAPHHGVSVPPGRQALAAASAGAGTGLRVAVIGAGLAGAAVARALADQGLAVQVYERQGHSAAETSGNPAGLFHGAIHGQDGPHARWLRAAALHTERVLRPLIEAGTVPGAIKGLLRGEQTLDAAAMAALIERLTLPAAYVSVRANALPNDPSCQPGQPGRPGQPGSPAWLYPGGGWVDPAALCTHWLATPGIHTRYNTAVHSLLAVAGRWHLRDAQGRVLDEVDAVLLCNAADAQRLVPQPPHHPPWPLRRLRGQTTLLRADTPGLPALPLPVADSGYALRLHDGRLLCGGSAQADDDEPGLRDADHALHLTTLRRLTGWPGSADPAALDGRVGWRLQADDRLPLLGPVPVADLPPTYPRDARPGDQHRDPYLDQHRDQHRNTHRQERRDQPRFVPRQPGLYVFTALGSRGITQAALGGEVLAAWLTGAPVAAPASLLDALDPARFMVRAHRRAIPPNR